MFKGLKEPTKYEYRVEMINHKNRNASVIREYSSTFEVGECWGYNKFYKIDLLEKEGFILPEHDAIVFRFYIRAPNNYEKCKEQQKYIKSLEESRRVLQLQVEEYKRQLHERSGNSENVTPRYNVQLQNEGPSATDLPEEQQEEPVPPVEQTEHETEEPPTVTNDSAIDDRQLTPLMIAREKKRQSISRNISVRKF
jgi:tripartite motif-containing protein 37